MSISNTTPVRRTELARALLEQACEATESGKDRKARELLKRAAALGSAEAKINLGNLYAEGQGVRRSAGLAKELYRSAFKSGSVYGATALGVQYKSEGKLKLARLWWTKAADLGEEWASEYLQENPEPRPVRRSKAIA